MTSHLLLSVRLLVFVACVLLCGMAGAANGLNLIGFGHESTMMGGADIAIARDSSALNTNPAGMAAIHYRLLDLEFAWIDTDNIRHTDAFANRAGPDNSPFYGAGFGFVNGSPGSRFNWGIGVFGQGGVGIEYARLNTAFGSVDRLENTLLIAKLSTGVSMQVNKRMAIGGSLAWLRSDLDLDFFPNTSFFDPMSPGTAFFGIQTSDTVAEGLSAKFGIQYILNSDTTLAATYTTQTVLDFSGSDFTADLTALGLGKVKYGSVKIDGRRQPQELAIGIAHRFTDVLLVSAEVNWIDWSSAVDTATLSATQPSNMLAPAVMSLSFVDEWDDQVVIALGLAYELSANSLLRAGYNYGRNPVPSANLSPLMPAISEHHVTLGFGYRHDTWEFSGGFQFDVENEVTYTNTRLPFGANATESVEAWSLILAATRRW